MSLPGGNGHCPCSSCWGHPTVAHGFTGEKGGNNPAGLSPAELQRRMRGQNVVLWLSRAHDAREGVHLNLQLTRFPTLGLDFPSHLRATRRRPWSPMAKAGAGRCRGHSRQ